MTFRPSKFSASANAMVLRNPDDFVGPPMPENIIEQEVEAGRLKRPRPGPPAWLPWAIGLGATGVALLTIVIVVTRK